MRRLWYILLFVVISFVVLPHMAWAQLDARDISRAQRSGQQMSLGGANSFGNMAGANMDQAGDMMQENGDSTATQRIHKPLESYYFSDSIRALPNFQWTIDKDMNDVVISPLDTTLMNWRIDCPYYLKGVGDMTMGGLGQATLPFNYFERPNSPDFEFAQPYDSYTYRMDNVPFYNSKTPYFNMMYLESGQKRYREEHFEVIMAHNASPTTSFNVNYKSRGTNGLYDWQRTRNKNLSAAFAHTGRQYSIHAGYINNRIEQQENGGSVGLWAVADTTFEHPSGIPMKLAESKANNSYRNSTFYVKQAYALPLVPLTDYDFSVANLPAVYFGHVFEYNSWSKLYTDERAAYTDERGELDENGEYKPTTDNYYYKDWFISPKTSRDSIRERVVSNKLFVEAQPWDRNGAVGRLGGGVGVDLHYYSHFDWDSYFAGKQTVSRQTAWYAYGAVSGKIKRFVDWGADIKYYPSGYRGGDLSLDGYLTLTARFRGHPVILSGRFSQTRQSPSYWQENLFSNHYVWSNSFEKEDETRLEVSLEIPSWALEFGAWQGVVSNKIYYGANSLVAQHSDAISLTSLYARKDFRIGGLHLDHRVLLQWSTNQEVIPVPLCSAYLSYYYEFWVEKKHVLRMQIGIDGRFNTSYYAPAYNPALSAFYNQRDYKMGDYPYLDAYITAKWKRMRIFLKYQHLNQGLFGNGEFMTIAGHPQNPGMIKMGISWGFYD